MHLDKDLKEISYEQWNLYLADQDYFRLKYSMLHFDKEQRFEVITSWIGYDIEGKNEVFATKIFKLGESTDLGKWKLKFKSSEEALKAHEKACERVKAGSYSQQTLDAEYERQLEVLAKEREIRVAKFHKLQAKRADKKKLKDLALAHA